jgi:hypothetical protein
VDTSDDGLDEPRTLAALNSRQPAGTYYFNLIQSLWIWDIPYNLTYYSTVIPIPTTGIPTTGIPTTGIPTTGIPTTGIPTTGIPTTGIPITTSIPPETSDSGNSNSTENAPGQSE